MKILIAPDSYKGTIPSSQAMKIIAEAAAQVFPAAELLTVPMADGGEGTVEALSYGKALSYHTLEVSTPLGNLVTVTYPITSDGTAILEMASASGITLDRDEPQDPLRASSYGTGELMCHAAQAGATAIVMGIGGTATNDGGMGAMEALGVKFYDAKGVALKGCGEALAQVHSIDLRELNPMIKDCHIKVICDVTNPLLGSEGATSVYGPQKGVTPQLVPMIEAGMVNYSAVLTKTFGVDNSTAKGAGAAGGMGAALLTFLGASLAPGIQVVLDSIDFDSLLEDVDLVITGEGNIDGQSVLYGKVPTGIMRRCRPKGIPVIVVAGGMGDKAELFWQEGEGSIITCINAAMPIEQALDNAPKLLRSAAERALRLVRMGMKISSCQNDRNPESVYKPLAL